jgi:hypothetical protein
MVTFFLMTAGLAAFSANEAIAEIGRLSRETQGQQTLVTFDMATLLFAGFLPGFLGLVVWSGALVVGRRLPGRLEKLVWVTLVVAVFVGIGGRVIGPLIVGPFVEARGYEHCPLLSKSSMPRLQRHAWVLAGHGLCQDQIDLKGRTLEDVKKERSHGATPPAL